LAFSTFLFDLDGTLTDPFEGITRSIQYALENMGAEVPHATDLKWCIGPPLWDSFKVLLKTDNQIDLDRAVDLYRERYTVTGLFENTLIAGVPELLKTLTGDGRRLHVCTSKPHSYAGKIVEHFGLRDFFGTVFGSELDGTRSAKADLISHILETEDLSASDVVMIGDRKHDLIGANANNVASIGVLWGYGDQAELQSEDPIGIAQRPQEILDIIDSAKQA
jgi:phosphoglycolate phosphatase